MPRPNRAREGAPNVLFIVMDTLRADRMSCYGYDKPTTPNVDRLAERGMRFERAFATSSWTWPSTASVLTGMGPLEHGVTGHRSCYLAHSLATLPKALQERGFTTAAFSANPPAWFRYEVHSAPRDRRPPWQAPRGRGGYLLPRRDPGRRADRRCR